MKSLPFRVVRSRGLASELMRGASYTTTCGDTSTCNVRSSSVCVQNLQRRQCYDASNNRPEFMRIKLLIGVMAILGLLVVCTETCGREVDLSSCDAFR